MAIIDKGEKHLFKRRLLQADDTAIAWADVIDVTFTLSLYGDIPFVTWSKSEGGIVQDGNMIQFELDSSDLRSGSYFLRAELVVNDDRWDDGLSRDVTWETESVDVIRSPNPKNSSSSEADRR